MFWETRNSSEREGVLKGFSVGGRGASSLEGAWSGAVLSKGFKHPGAIFLGRMCGARIQTRTREAAQLRRVSFNGGWTGRKGL